MTFVEFAIGLHSKVAYLETFDMPENAVYAKLKVGNAAAAGPAYDQGAGKVNDCAPALDVSVSTPTSSVGVVALCATTSNM